jgi:hypothetical protein
MTSVGQALQEVVLFGPFAVLFLGSAERFLAYRRRRALARGEERSYVAQADPWLPALLALIGAGWIALLHFLR